MTPPNRDTRSPPGAGAPPASLGTRAGTSLSMGTPKQPWAAPPPIMGTPGHPETPLGTQARAPWDPLSMDPPLLGSPLPMGTLSIPGYPWAPRQDPPPPSPTVGAHRG